MAVENILTIGARIAGLFLFMNALSLLAPILTNLFVSTAHGAQARAILNMYLLLSLFCFAVSILMIWKPQNFARAVLPANSTADASTEKTQTPLSFDEWQTLAFSMVGIYFMVSALSHMGNWLSSLLMSRSAEQFLQQITNPFSIPWIIQLLFGFWLLIGARGLCRLLHFLRATGS